MRGRLLSCLYFTRLGWDYSQLLEGSVGDDALILPKYVYRKLTLLRYVGEVRFRRVEIDPSPATKAFIHPTYLYYKIWHYIYDEGPDRGSGIHILTQR